MQNQNQSPQGNIVMKMNQVSQMESNQLSSVGKLCFYCKKC